MDNIFNAGNEGEPGNDDISRLASGEVNASILRDLRQEEAEPSCGLEEVVIAYTERQSDRSYSNFFVAENGAELVCLGSSLAKNSWLEKLTINASSLRHLELDDINVFFRGLARNRSIAEYEVLWMDAASFDVRVMESMSTFLRDNHNLVSLSLHNCELGADGWRLVAQGLKDNPAKELQDASFGACPDFGDIYDNPIEDESVAEIIDSLASYSSLSRLSLQCTNMAIRGCTALAHLLDQSTCNIGYIDLEFTKIDDPSVNSMLPSLAENGEQLRHIGVSRSSSISDRKLLDLFSILKEHDINGYWRNVELADLLARGDFGIEELYEYDVKLLPNLAAVFDRAIHEHQARGWRHEPYENWRFDLIYNFLRGMPTVGAETQVAGMGHS